LRLLAYLALSIALLVLDHRGGWLTQLRAQANVLVQPLWWVAGMPARLGDTVRDDAATRARLSDENRRLRNALLISNARQGRLQVAAAENERLRGLLGAAERGRLDVQLAPILNIDLDPTRQRLILDAGSRNGAHMGQTVIDAGGLVGQVIEVTPITATVLLITDPDHAVPVAVARSGVRLVAYGKGRSDELDLANIPMSGDVKVGDTIVTSGLGGRFPAGFPVGTIAELHPDDSRAFLVGKLKPAAQLDRGRDVLLLRQVIETVDVMQQVPAAVAKADAQPDSTAELPGPPASAADRNAAPGAGMPAAGQPPSQASGQASPVRTNAEPAIREQDAPASHVRQVPTQPAPTRQEPTR